MWRLLNISKNSERNRTSGDGMREKRKATVVFRSIARYVLVENAPSLILTSTFFCLKFDDMSDFALAKNGISFVSSGRYSLGMCLAIASF